MHAGGSTDAYAILQRGGREHLDEITNASAPFWRDASRKAPHNLYTNEIKLRQAAAKKGYAETVNIPTFPFLPATSNQAHTPDVSRRTTGQSATENSSTTAITGAGTTTKSATAIESNHPMVATSQQPVQQTNELSTKPSTPSGTNDVPMTPTTDTANQIELRFLLQSYKVGYVYNGMTRLYTRQINGKDHIDRNDNKPLTAANVIVLAGSYKVLDHIGRLSLNIDAGGKALLFQQGKIVRDEWKHAAGDAIRFYSGGKEMPLVIGTTYYTIVPDTVSFYSHLTIDGEKWD